MSNSSTTTRPKVTIDGNEAAAYVAHQSNEVIAIYPITPSSNMGEWADQWSAEQKTNIWGTVPTVIEMQSEGGAAGALHGALQAGSLSTTFTASQGLLLMIPNMYKIAGELTSHGLPHRRPRPGRAGALDLRRPQRRDGARSTGFGMLSSNSVQEVMDMALIAQAATLEARIPFMHFFDGFRTSHEVAKVEQLTADDMRAMIDENLVFAHRARALSPDRPVHPRHRAESRRLLPGARSLQSLLPGRPHHRAERDGQVRRDRRPPVSPLRLLRRARCRARHHHDGLRRRSGPRDGGSHARRRRKGRPAQGPPLPALRHRGLRRRHPRQSSNRVAVLDRTKEPGATGEPLYCDVVTAFAEMGIAQEGHRRTLRTLVQGIHAGHGQGRLRRTAQGPRPRITSPSASRTTSPTPAWITIPTSPPKRPAPCARCSTASARMAPSAPTRTPSRSSAKRPTTSPRATSFTTPRSPAPSPPPTCASDPSRSAPATSSPRRTSSPATSSPSWNASTC